MHLNSLYQLKEFKKGFLFNVLFYQKSKFKKVLKIRNFEKYAFLRKFQPYRIVPYVKRLSLIRVIK